MLPPPRAIGYQTLRPPALLVVALAGLLSLALHTVAGLVLSAAWFAPKRLEDEAERRKWLLPPPPPAIVLDLDDTDYDARVADAVEIEPKVEAPIIPAAPAARVEQPALLVREPAARPVGPSPQPAAQRVEPQRLAVQREASAPAHTAGTAPLSQSGEQAPGSALPSASATATASTAAGAPASPSSSASGSASASAPGSAAPTALGDGPGEGAPAEQAPDVVARFAKDLPRWGVELGAWTEVPAGTKLEAKLTIQLDAKGRVVFPREEPQAQEAEAARDALSITMQRTLRGLFTKLALPDQPVRAGRALVSVQALVSDGPAPHEDIEIAFSYTKETRRGRSRFVLKSGRTVVFEVAALSVELEEPGPAQASP